MPPDRWSHFGDRKEARRLRKAGLWYDSRTTLPGEQLSGEFLELMGGRYLERFGGWDGELILAPLEWCVWLARGAAAELRTGVGGTPCGRWAKHVQAAFNAWTNNNGGGWLAVWELTARKIAFHPGPPTSSPHRFNLVRTSDVGWWVLDSAFVLGTRGVYQVGPEDAGFYGMEL